MEELQKVFWSFHVTLRTTIASMDLVCSTVLVSQRLVSPTSLISHLMFQFVILHLFGVFSSFTGAFWQISTQQVSVHDLAHLHVCGGGWCVFIH